MYGILAGDAKENNVIGFYVFDDGTMIRAFIDPDSGRGGLCEFFKLTHPQNDFSEFISLLTINGLVEVSPSLVHTTGLVDLPEHG